MILILSILLITAYFMSLYPTARDFRFSEKDAVSAADDQLPAVSLVIPFRNERENLPALLMSLSQLQYPHNLFEVVLVDDHSTDDGMQYIHDALSQIPFRWQLLETPADTEGKKAALRTGIQAAAHSLIVGTDADCSFHPLWLRSIAGAFQQQTLLLAAPVRYTATDKNLLFSFQAMESAMLMAITAKSIAGGKALLANGANLSFYKSLYEQAESLRRDDKLPGGDDIFLLEAAMRISPDSIQFRAHETLMVNTRAESSWQGMINQRTRWASKVRFQADRSGFVSQVMAALFSLAFVLGMLSLLAGAHVVAAMLLLGGKCITDLLCMQRVLPAFSYQVPVWHQLLASWVQPFIILAVAWKVMFGTYQWRGRRFGV